MVRKEVWLYLLIGEDPSSKDTKLKEIRRALLPPSIENFNLDTLYAKNLNLKELQEKLLCLPVRTKKRLLIIRQAGLLKEELRDFLLEYAKNPASHITLVLDFEHYSPKDEFITRITRMGVTYRFKEKTPVNTFNLTRQIELKRPDYALKVLQQLLKEGEKPERILGGLRYSLLRPGGDLRQARRVARLLLDCDIALKTSRLKPAFALEKTVIELSSLRDLAR